MTSITDHGLSLDCPRCWEFEEEWFRQSDGFYGRKVFSSPRSKNKVMYLTAVECCGDGFVVQLVRPNSSDEGGHAVYLAFTMDPDGGINTVTESRNGTYASAREALLSGE